MYTKSNEIISGCENRGGLSCLYYSQHEGFVTGVLGARAHLDVLIKLAVSSLRHPLYREISPAGSGMMLDDPHSGESSPSTI